MNRRNIGTICTVIGLTFAGTAGAAPLNRDDFRAEKERIETQAKADRKACDSFSGNAKDICEAEAKGKEKVARAELEAQYKPSDKARRNLGEARAEAAYEVAKERCDDRAGNQKDLCLEEAKAAQKRAKADAEAGMKAAAAGHEADEKAGKAREKAVNKSHEAQKDAAEEKREADYAVAREKCNTLAGDAKDRCQNEAKTRFGK